MDFGLMVLGAGIAAAGYFIGEGLKNFKNPTSSSTDDIMKLIRDEPVLVKQEELHTYIGISKRDTESLLEKYQDIPRIELDNKTYVPYKQVMEWMEQKENFTRNTL